MDVDLVLAPVDTSAEAAEALEYAIAIADEYGAELHLLQVLDEGVQRDLDRGDRSAAEVARAHQEFAADVETDLESRDGIAAFSHSTVAGYSRTRLSRTPGSAILDVADQVEADFVVIPRETQTDDPERTIGKAALYVIEYASQPVVSV